jgi:hypothetical protein
MNNVITASRMATLISCPRKHFWGNEIGLQKESTGHALRFGSAWHRGMESRWNGATYEEALAAAIPVGIDLDEYSCATLSAMLAGYYDAYGETERVGKLHPEIQFDFELIDGFRAQGKIDGLGSLRDNRSVLVESKTTSDSVSPDSEYWMRLRFNMQVHQYVDASRRLGWDIAEVIYDVARKPMIKPSKVYDLDTEGRKIVLDAKGNRVFGMKKVIVPPKKKLKKGEKGKTEYREVPDESKPRQSASDGQVLKFHTESPEEFSERLWRDTLARRDFYFCRKEVPILDGDVDMFNNQRIAMVRLIQHFRMCESTFDIDSYECGDIRDPEAWPRNISDSTCTYCPFKSFCLQNITININQPPEGFMVKPFNPELESYDTTTETADASTDAGSAR